MLSPFLPWSCSSSLSPSSTLNDNTIQDVSMVYPPPEPPATNDELVLAATNKFMKSGTFNNFKSGGIRSY